MKIGIFTDIHFQPSGLDRIVKTGKWIVEEFTRRKVDLVVCMGDALVTREEVDVVAQSAALNLFRELAEHWPVHLALGNHDLNLKHSSSVSSLDALDMHPRIKVHREIGLVVVNAAAGPDLLMVPYHEDSSIIVKWIADHVAKTSPERVKNTVPFAHMGLNGAVINTRFGTRCTAAIGPDLFAPFRRTYIGHYHPHQRMEHRVCFVGSPLQHNFGDAGNKRGVVVYDTFEDTDEFILNPYYDAFKIIRAADIAATPASELRDRFVTVVYDNLVTPAEHADVQARLEQAGVLTVREESVVERAIRENTMEVTGVEIGSALGLVEPFVKSILPADGPLKPEVVIKLGRSIISEINARFGTVSDTGLIFEADPVTIEIENFLGIRGPIVVNLGGLAPGCWYLEGKNGHGKSTLLDAFTWCNWGEVIRSDMLADDVIWDPEHPNRSNKGKNCRVKTTYANGYVIDRFRKYTDLGGTGVKVYKDGTYQEKLEKAKPVDTQREINNLLGTDRDTFVRTGVLSRAIFERFVSEEGKQRRAIFESMLGLERFDDYLVRTRELKKSINDQFDQQEAIQKVRAGGVEQAAAQVTAIDGQIVTAEQAHAARLDHLAQEIHNENQAFTADMQSFDADQLPRAEAQIPPVREIVERAQVLVRELEAGVGDVAAKAKALRAQAEAKRRQVSAIRTPIALREQQIEALRREEAEIQSAISAVETRATSLRKALTLEPAVIAANSKATDLRFQAVNADREQAVQLATAAGHASLANTKALRARRLHELPPGDCDACAQPVDKAGLDNIVKGIVAEVSELKRQEGEARATAEKAGAEAAALRAEAEVVLKGVATPAQIQAAKVALAQAEVELANRESSLLSFPLRIAAANQHTLSHLVGHCQMVAGITDITKAVNIANGHPDGYTYVLERESTELEAQATRLESDAEHTAQTERLETARRGVQGAQEALRGVEGALAAIRQARSAREARNAATVASLNQETDRVKASDPTAGLKATRERLVADRTKALAELESSRKLAANLSVQAGYIGFWDRAFAAKGTMRAYLLERSVGQFNAVVAGYAKQHFGGRMPLTFDSDLTIQESFGRRSGGQRQWTMLAAFFGLFEVSQQRSRWRSRFMGLDEVFDAFDVDGRKAAADLINTMAQRVGKILVIAHVDIPGVHRAGVIQVVMDNPEVGTTFRVRPV